MWNRAKTRFSKIDLKHEVLASKFYAVYDYQYSIYLPL